MKAGSGLIFTTGETGVGAIVGGGVVLGGAAYSLYENLTDDSWGEMTISTPTTYPLPASESITLNPPFAIPVPYATVDGIETIEDDGMITLFRGVSEDHADYENAEKGIALPRGGNATPLEHNLHNTKSNYTSWTRNPFIAYGWATEGGIISGIVLVKQFKKSEVVKSPDHLSEGEVLIQGPVHLAIPVPVDGWIK